MGTAMRPHPEALAWSPWAWYPVGLVAHHSRREGIVRYVARKEIAGLRQLPCFKVHHAAAPLKSDTLLRPRNHAPELSLPHASSACL